MSFRPTRPPMISMDFNHVSNMLMKMMSGRSWLLLLFCLWSAHYLCTHTIILRLSGVFYLIFLSDWSIHPSVRLIQFSSYTGILHVGISVEPIMHSASNSKEKRKEKRNKKRTGTLYTKPSTGFSYDHRVTRENARYYNLA